MIGIWFKEDIDRILAEHRYVVVTDANGEGEFLLKYLPEDIKQLPISNEYSEIEAKYLAESKYVDSPVLFYVRKKAAQLSFLQEYVQTGGLLVLDDMEAYIKQKLFEATGKNTHLTKDQLLLAAKLPQPVRRWMRRCGMCSEVKCITLSINLKRNSQPKRWHRRW